MALLPRSKSMQALRRSAVLAAAVIVGAATFPAPAPAANDLPTCIRVWAEARYRGFGYDHIVHVGNSCAAPAICDVFTNVTPARLRVTVPAGQEVEVLTFRGSPAREFVAHAECGLVL